MTAAGSNVTHLWRSRLVANAEGNPKACASNALALLHWHPDWRGLLEYDAFAECVRTRRAPPWGEEVTGDAAPQAGDEWSEQDTVRLKDWIERTIHVSIATGDLEQAVAVNALKQRVHPVEDYLRRLRWDGVQRLPKWLTSYAGAESTLYSDAIGVRWMISAVARALRPGCQVDSMLILEGVQGAGKSSLWRTLVPDTRWYSETGIDIGQKDSYQAMRGVWIYLLDEIDSLKRGEITRVKNFLSSPKDRYRPSYARKTRDFLRQTVFCGSTNEHVYLQDASGNRRFWPVTVGTIDLASLARDRDQLWAEAVARFDSGEKWHLETEELRALAQAETDKRREPDPVYDKVREWLVTRLDGVTTYEVMTLCLGMQPADVTKSESMRIAQILRELNYVRGDQRREEGSRMRRYFRPSPPVTPEK